MNLDRQIRRVGFVLVCLFAAMFVRLNQLQVLQADELANHPGNTRNAVRDFGRPRGAIVTADGRVVARSVPNPDRSSKFENLREYPGGTLYGHVTGFFSFSFGSTGIEHSYNGALAGREGALTVKRLTDLLRDRTVTSDVRLTIRDSVQRAAARSLGQRRGSVVAIDPRTGAVLATVSYPSYDPAPLAALGQTGVQAAYKRLSDDPAKPLLARAYRERYFPGSTFKTVTAAVALQDEVATLETLYPELTALQLPLTNRPLRNFGGRLCGGTLVEVFTASCNTSFAQLALDIGPELLHEGAKAFGFDKTPPLDVSPSAVSSRFPEPSFFERNTPALAQAGIGQGDVAATPLQMALVAAGIANGGRIRQPYLVAEVRDQDGNVIEKARPKTWTTAVSPEVAAQVSEMMVSVVNNGTGTRAALAGTQVAAKTGTAQTGQQTAHAWTIAFAPAEAPTVAVAVIVENQPEVSAATGGRIAAPIAARVIDAALRAGSTS